MCVQSAGTKRQKNDERIKYSFFKILGNCNAFEMDLQGLGRWQLIGYRTAMQDITEKKFTYNIQSAAECFVVYKII